MPWEFRSDVPIYSQLVDLLQRKLVTGELSPGQRLPSVRELAGEAGVNPNTMQRAMSELERQGLVFSQRTAGRFVTEDERLINGLREQMARRQAEEFLEGMTRLGFGPEEILPFLETVRKEIV